MDTDESTLYSGKTFHVKNGEWSEVQKWVLTKWPMLRDSKHMQYPTKNVGIDVEATIISPTIKSMTDNGLTQDEAKAWMSVISEAPELFNKVKKHKTIMKGIVQGVVNGHENMIAYGQDYISHLKATLSLPVEVKFANLDDETKLLWMGKKWKTHVERELKNKNFAQPETVFTTENLTNDVERSFHAYTRGEPCLYFPLNQDLRDGTNKVDCPGVLYNIMIADGMPKYHGRVFRGQKEFYSTEHLYQPGNIVTWNNIVSTSTVTDVATNFSGGKVLFTIEEAKGVRVGHISAFPKESEVILLPGSRFRVLSKDGEKVRLKFLTVSVPRRVYRQILPHLFFFGLHHNENSDTSRMALYELMQYKGEEKYDVNAECPVCRKSRNAMYHCARNGIPDVMEQLLKFGAKAHCVIDEVESTPLHAAAFYKKKKCISHLLAATDIQASLHHKNKFGLTPIDEGLMMKKL
mmetsp:Transcript_33384/g.81054  ORF Transcript_33384/g.81054 Transcript_33384/m.81054 type:complete len:463 (+) Transcript_33384:111-1499(+)